MKGFTRLRSRVRPGKRSSRSASSPVLRRASFEHLEERLALSAGALDPSFGIGGKVLTNVGTMPTNDYARDVVAYQSDGKMIVVGQADADVAVVRYKADGSLDTTFGVEGKVKIDLGSYEFGRGVAIDSADRIIIGGVSYQGTTGYDFLAIRLTSSGLRDTTFDGDGIQTIDFAGSHDIGWGVAVDSLDRVIVGGYAYIGGGYDFAVARLTATGTLDVSFDGDGKQTIDFASSDDNGSGLAVDSLDRVIVGGYAHIGGDYDFAVARLTATGTLDGTFDADGKQTIDFGSTTDFGLSVALDGSEGVLVAGYSYQGGTGYDFAVAWLTGTGALDTAFDSDGKQTVDFGSQGDYGQGVTADSSGRVLLVGYSSQGVTGYDFAVARLTGTGALDTAFDSDGKQTVDFGSISDLGQAVAVDALERVLVAGFSWQGTSGDIGVARLSDSGALDASFDFDGKVLSDVGRPLYDYGFDVVAYDAHGKAVMVGSAYGHMAVVRYNPDGSLDTTFGTNGKVRIDIGNYDEARSVAIDSAGRIVIAGYSNQSSVVFAVVRLTPSGTLDTTFDGDGKQTINFTSQWDYGWSVAVDSWDRVLVTGYSYSNGAYDFQRGPADSGRGAGYHLRR